MTMLATILTQTDKIILSTILDLKSWGYYSCNNNSGVFVFIVFAYTTSMDA